MQDDGGTAVVNGVTGVDLDASPNVMTVNVTAVNDAPSGADATVTVQTNSAYTFHQADFGFTDANDTPANSLASVVLSTLPLAGSLTLNGNPVNAGDSILIADLDANRLVFTPVSGHAAYASFAFQVRDNGSNVPPNANLDPTPNTISINITIQHHAPAGTDKTISAVNEDQAYTLTVADFGFTDPQDTPADAFQSVRSHDPADQRLADLEWSARRGRSARAGQRHHARQAALYRRGQCQRLAV